MGKPTEFEKCLLCKRPLKTLESRIAGFGPSCLKKRQDLEIVKGVKLNETFPTKTQEVTE